MTIKLKTNIEIEECKLKISNAIDTRPLSLLFSPIEIVGSVGIERFWLQKRTKNFRNSYTRIFYGRFRKDDKGSVIEGSFKTLFFVKILIAIYFAGITTVCGFLIIHICFKRAQDNEIELIFFLLIAILMLLFGIFHYRLGAKLSKKEEEYLIMFLENTLNADKID